MLILTIVLTAVLSSVCTLGLAYWLFTNKLKQPLLDTIDNDLLPKLRSEVKQGVLDAGEELLPQFEARVKAGAIDAGGELLPQFRDNVREGFNDAIKDATGAQVLEDAAKTVSKTVENGINSLFGKR